MIRIWIKVILTCPGKYAKPSSPNNMSQQRLSNCIRFFLIKRITSPLDQSYDPRNASLSINYFSPPANNNNVRPTKHWITIYGFSPPHTSMILNHFAQCGTILEKVFPPQSGNWVHLRFASSLECEKALNYHERILANSLMIGVTYCKDPSIVDKENLERSKWVVIHSINKDKIGAQIH